MAKKSSIAQKLANHISEIEGKIAVLQSDLDVAKQNYENYLTHKQVIESILGLHEAPDVAAPKRVYKKRAPKN